MRVEVVFALPGEARVATVELDGLTPVFERILKSQVRGRTVVKVGA